MLSHRYTRYVAILLTAVAISGCGGGGGGDDDDAPPSSGAYAWLLKAQGPTDALKFGLSLVHPSAPNVEYVIESASINVTDARVVSSGSVDAAGERVTGVQPYALIYVVGGDVRRVPLIANGQLPRPQVQRANTSSACELLLDAIDYANPERSRFVVSTTVTGDCDTSSTGSAEVRFDPSLGLVLTPLSARPLGVVRDPVTLAPRGWITSTTATFWSPSPDSTVTLRTGGQPAIAAVVSNSYRSAVVESAAGGLSVLDFPGGDAFTETVLTGPAGSDWQPIGYDSNRFYVYQNTGGAGTAAWQVYAVSRSGVPSAQLLSSGSGQVALASMGSNILYLTVLGATNNTLVSVTKSAPASTIVLETLAAANFVSVTTSNAGVHQLWRVTGVGTASAGYRVEFIDEVFNKLYTSPAGALPFVPIEPTAIAFNNSENGFRFVFATGARTLADGEPDFSDSALVAYDAVARAVTAVGTLPGSADFGTDPAYANVATGPTTAAAGFIGRAVSGVVQEAGARVFSFDAATAGSLKLTTTQQQ